MDYLYLLIESKSQASNKKGFTVSSDVYNNMAQFSTNIFWKRKYALLYKNIYNRKNYPVPCTALRPLMPCCH